MKQRIALLSLLYSGALLARHMGIVIRTEFLKGGGSFAYFDWTIWLGILLFGASLALIRNHSMEKIASMGMNACLASLLVSLLFFRNSIIGYFLSTELVAKLLPVLGWGMLNQMASENEAKKQYVSIHILVGLLVTPLSFLPNIVNHNSSLYFWFLGGASLFCIFLARRFTWSEPKNSPNTAAYSWSTLLIFPILANGIQCVNILSAIGFQEKMSSMQYAQSCSILMGIGILVCAVLFWKFGSQIIEHKGLSFAWMGAVAIGTLATLIAYFSQHPYTFATCRALLVGVQNFWVFPLMQIACMHYAPPHRFFLQAASYLVLGPILEMGFAFLDKGHIYLMSFAIFSLMGLLLYRQKVYRESVQ